MLAFCSQIKQLMGTDVHGVYVKLSSNFLKEES